MKKNLLSGLLAGVMAVSLVACGNSESTPAADSTTETAKPATAENSDTFDVEMVGNSFSIEYCNINVDGARDAVDDLAKKGVTVNLTYNASADSSQVDEQINILNQALAKQPNAILIAACDSGALDEQMITARDAGIPVIAYDITFDNAPEGSLTATSASDSILAAGQAAVEVRRRNAHGLQRQHLILHQRHQRRNHQRHPRQQQCRHLVAEGLAPAGGHQHKGIIPGQHIFNDCFLIPFKGIKTKMFFELFCQIILLRHTIHNFKNRRSGHLQTVYVRFFKLFLRILQRDMECLFICRRHTVHGIHHHSLHNGT